MDRYYYFASTLPMLAWDAKPPMERDEFLRDCERLLDVHDFRLIENVFLAEPRKIKTRHDFYNQWMERLTKFRNELVFWRAQKAGKDPYAHVRGMHYPDPYLRGMIEQAAQAEHPLAVERKLDAFHWQFLEDATTCHYFDFTYIVGYALKLKILERYQRIRSSQGQETFARYREKIVSKTKEKIGS
jgi:hypothetical protein